MTAPRDLADIQPVIESVLSNKSFEPDEREEYASAMIIVLLRMLSLSTYLDVSVRARFTTKEVLEPLIVEAEAILSVQSKPATPKWAKKRAAPKSQSTLPRKKKKNEDQAIGHEVGETPPHTLVECLPLKITPEVKVSKVVKKKAKQNTQENFSIHGESLVSSKASGGVSLLTQSQEKAKRTTIEVECSKKSYEKAVQQAMGKRIGQGMKLDAIDASEAILQTPSEDSNSANRTVPEVKTPKKTIIKSMQQTLTEYLNPKKGAANENEVSEVSSQSLVQNGKLAKDASSITKTSEASEKKPGLINLTSNLRKVLLGRCEKLEKVCEVVAMKMELEKKIKAICDEENIEISVIKECYEFASKKFEPWL